MAVGRLNWKQDKVLTGTHARLAGLLAAVGRGGAGAAVGVLFPTAIWNNL